MGLHPPCSLEKEPNARKKYSEEEKVTAPENGIAVHPDLPWLGSSVDGIVMNAEGEPVKVLEIKSLAAGIQKSAA